LIDPRLILTLAAGLLLLLSGLTSRQPSPGDTGADGATEGTAPPDA
jgi:hypothetical protein